MSMQGFILYQDKHGEEQVNQDFLQQQVLEQPVRCSGTIDDVLNLLTRDQWQAVKEMLAKCYGSNRIPGLVTGYDNGAVNMEVLLHNADVDGYFIYRLEHQDLRNTNL